MVSETIKTKAKDSRMNFTMKNVCRTCVTENETLSKIHETDITVGNNSTPVIELLSLFTLVELDECVPNSICMNCVDKVTDFYKFKIQCDNSNVLLKQYLSIKSECRTKDCTDRAPSDVDVGYSENETIEYIEHKESSIQVETKSHTNSKSDESSNDQFPCVDCNKSFKTNSSLSAHIKCHIREGRFSCELCSKKFVTKCRLSNHLKVAHKEENKELACIEKEQINSYICNTCNKTFKSKYILAVHEKRHLHKGHFLCPTCGKGFNSKGCLNRHNRVHTGEKKYECRVCKKKFPSSNNLNLHFRIHSGIKPYLCTICGKSFTHPTGLTYHTRTHTKEKNYHCDMCDKSFAIQCHLDNHRKRHTGERPFACGQCEKAFIKKVDLQRHEAVHGGIKPHICNICNKEFLRLLHLNYHMMIHTEERPHKCAYCGRGFIRKYYLKDHMKKHHDVTDFPSIKN